MRHLALLPFSLLLGVAACTPESALELSSSESAGTAAPSQTFDLQAYIFCPTGQWCGHANQAALIAAYYRSVAEINLEYRAANLSYRPLPPIITQDDRFSTMTGPDNILAGNGELNTLLQFELTISRGSPHTNRVTMFLTPNLERCWNGIPCPGQDDNFDGDDVVFCTPPAVADPAGTGSTYAHELGHYWCLRHTFTADDASGPGIVDHDGDDDACDTLSNVSDTPPDPKGREASDRDSNGDPVAWHEWCNSTQLSDVDADSPHDSRCSVECFQAIGGQVVETNYSPLTENAMSYYGWACRGPWIVGGERHEAFTPGQAAQIQECRLLVPQRLLLVEVCAAHGGDTDNDGTCDDDDACPDTANTPTDGDGDGIPDDCDACPTDPTAYNSNTDGDAWCNVHDVCPFIANATATDTDGDGIWNDCDSCPFVSDPSNLDTDHDGAGDVCDTDDDNDLCADSVDQHPKDDRVSIGPELRPNCSPSSVPHLASESVDTDGDHLRDCRDTDDDNDGILDVDDPCPTIVGTSCVFNGPSCPLAPVFFTCRTGGCNAYLLRIIEAVNPDPTRAIELPIVSASRTEVVVTAATGRTLADTSLAVRGLLPLTTGRLSRGALRVEVVDARSHRAVFDLATYTPWTATAVIPTGATRLQLTLPTSAAPLAITGLR